MDKYYGNVCELDIIFNFQKAYFILDELLLAGEMQESSKKNVLRCISQQDSLEDMEVSHFLVKSSNPFSLLFEVMLCVPSFFLDANRAQDLHLLIDFCSSSGRGRCCYKNHVTELSHPGVAEHFMQC
jgi:hypothetical protein